MLSKLVISSTFVLTGLASETCLPEGAQCGAIGACCEQGTECYAMDPSRSECRASQPDGWVKDPQKFECSPGDKCNVLVVVDMQNDYCLDCGESQDGCHWPFRSPLESTAAKINKAVTDAGVDFDFVVFTEGLMSWETDDGKCTFPNTRGFQIIDALKTTDDSFLGDPTKDVMHFSKLTDDWFTNAVFSDRQFANNGETLPFWNKDLPPTLPEQLAYRNLKPDNTQLFVTGTATNRCVMKGAVHARQLGFDVVLAKDAVTGGSEDRWVISKVTIPEGPNACAIPSETGEYSNLHHCAVALSCEEQYNTQKCTEEEKQEWMGNVYFGWRGGPSQNDAFKYLENSGVVVVDDVMEFANPTSASCNNPQHGMCNGLAGNCCPAADGTMLACCNQSQTHLFAPAPSTPAPKGKKGPKGGKGRGKGGKGGKKNSSSSSSE